MQSNTTTQTEMNLMQAFAGESQANRKYLAFAMQAEKEGYPQAGEAFQGCRRGRNRSCPRASPGFGEDRDHMRKTSRRPLRVRHSNSQRCILQ